MLVVQSPNAYHQSPEPAWSPAFQLSPMWSRKIREITMTTMAKCRNCSKIYNPDKSSANWEGYCSQKCVHAKAKALGYSKARENAENKMYPYRLDRHSEYTVLRDAKQIGRVIYYAPPNAPPTPSEIAEVEEQRRELELEIKAAEAEHAFRKRISEYVEEYINEAEHQDGYGYWQKFDSIPELVQDFAVYLRALQGTDDEEN